MNDDYNKQIQLRLTVIEKAINEIPGGLKSPVYVTNILLLFLLKYLADVITRLDGYADDIVKIVDYVSPKILASDRRVVPTAGTPVQLADNSITTELVIITAETDNTGVIAVGGNSVLAALASRKGTPLFAGDSITLHVADLLDIWLDATVDGDGVIYTYSRKDVKAENT